MCKPLALWCQENTVSFNVNKTKEMIVDFRKQQREKTPIHIDGTAVEKLESFKFLGVHITDDLKWSTYRDSVVPENNLSLNVNKTKEMIMDFRKQQREHPPIYINGTAVVKVESFKFLGVHITDKLKWSTHAVW